MFVLQFHSENIIDICFLYRKSVLPSWLQKTKNESVPQVTIS